MLAASQEKTDGALQQISRHRICLFHNEYSAPNTDEKNRAI